MVRRGLYLLSAMTMVWWMVLPAAADSGGRIHLCFDYGETVTEGTVILCRVAEPLEENYRLADWLGGGVIRQEDANAPELAQWLAERAGESGEMRFLDADGCAEYQDLDGGLYLLIQTEAPGKFECCNPFLIPMPLNGSWEVHAQPKTAQVLTESPRTAQRPAPLFGAMGLVLSGSGLCVCLEKLRKK